ncbi:MAG: 16S rRNA (cytosine(967)-C(5))-methyltransferase RsmB [Lachnospiraceae bacterium]|nr:16S rRNA (cytosine(967)-C(5))-methyltransferase RsmB [Lachnospiraceae bacterium]
MDNMRELALDVLFEILEKGGYSHLVIRNVLDKYDYSDPRNKAFVKRVTEGTIERLIQIDYVLEQFSKVPVGKMKPLIRTLMRMSVYQLLFMDQIPDAAICNEAVKLSGKRGFRGLSGFVNGVLRNIARNRGNIQYPDKSKEWKKSLSVSYSMPEWLIDFWQEAYGRETMEKLLEGLFCEHPVTVRVKKDLSHKQKEAWIQELSKEGIGASLHPYHACAYRLSGALSVKKLPGYGEGLFAVQDVSSMLAVEAAGITFENAAETKEPLLVMDVCAAPGGKTMHMAEKLGKRGRVYAFDLTEYKVTLIRDNIKRMGCENVEVHQHDASIPEPSFFGRADVVLADLPCSGLGTMGKKRDVKYRATKESMEELTGIQKKILEVVWKYVKPGGVLIYSTCTLNPKENEQMASWFTEHFPFRLDDLSPYLPKALSGKGKEGMLQLFPGIHESDGFFIARMIRDKA